MSEWSKPSFNGRFDYVCVFKVISDYFESSEPKIWETSPNGRWKNELFPHRFKFNKNPLLIMKDLKVKDLSASSKSELQNTVYVNFRMCEPDTLVDIMHEAIQVNVVKYDEVLREIPKLQ
jgi:hypothetical protein